MFIAEYCGILSFQELFSCDLHTLYKHVHDNNGNGKIILMG